MGYAYGIKWTDEKIKEEIYKVMNALNIERMPSSAEIESVTGNFSLSNALARRGGIRKWAKMLNLKQSVCETRIGQQGEYLVKEILETKGYKVEKMSMRHPYDLLVNDNVKIDVKTSNKYISPYGWSSYSFNLEKTNPTCDIYVVVCKDIKKILVIPSKYLKQSQLCIGATKSKYDVYQDRWDYIEQYSKFYEEVI